MKHVKIRLDVWEALIFVFWDCEPKDIAKFMKKRYKGMPAEICDTLNTLGRCQGACIHREGESSQVIWLSQSPKKKPSILAHEAIHAVAHVMRHWGIVVNYDTEEILTSGVSLIIDEVSKHKS